jgi:hypothetical protein
MSRFDYANVAHTTRVILKAKPKNLVFRDRAYREPRCFASLSMTRRMHVALVAGQADLEGS